MSEHLSDTTKAQIDQLDNGTILARIVG
jgi:hypothetical protein